MRENILITGGAGFLGSHLCRELLKLDFSIICMDNLFTGEIRNIKTLMNNPRFKFLEHDVTIQKDSVTKDIKWKQAEPFIKNEGWQLVQVASVEE